MPLQILVVEPHRVLADALTRTLRTAGPFDVRPVASVADAVRALAELRPAGAVRSAEQPVPVSCGAVSGNGGRPDGDAVRSPVVLVHAGPAQQEAVRALASEAAGGQVVVLVDDATAGAVQVLRDAGAHRVVPGSAGLADLVALLTGREGAEAAPPVRLSPREREVLVLKGNGYSTAEVAQRLGLSVHTVRDHLKRILGKLDAHSQLEAVIVAGRLGLLTPGD